MHTKLELPRSPFGKSDHNYILLIPAYKLKPKQEVPVTRSIRKWADDADAAVLDCFASMDRNMYWDSSNGIEEYTINIESYYTNSDDRRMWQGLKTIMDYKGKPRCELPSDASQPDELNAFYACFKTTNTEACTRAPAVLDDCGIKLSVAHVNKTFMHRGVNVNCPVAIFMNCSAV
jgi:hypothetical protein